ncbi:MAG: hypothetical protein N4A74_07445 [Carboxylicivirga sp.]|jgi:hypothetical protein|nr:hypothetical protein [Carboxylicivirga sp.]
MKYISYLIISVLFSTLTLSCLDDSPTHLSITNVEFTQTYHNQVLDLPNGTFIPDNPNFNFDNPETWTGNMAQYVNNNYLYNITYTIKNDGNKIAFAAEVDIHYLFDNGDETVKTIFLGDIRKKKSYTGSTSIGCTNKQLVECRCEAFWSD